MMSLVFHRNIENVFTIFQKQICGLLITNRTHRFKMEVTSYFFFPPVVFFTTPFIPLSRGRQNKLPTVCSAHTSTMR